MTSNERPRTLQEAIERAHETPPGLDAVIAAVNVREAAERLEFDAVRAARSVGTSWSKIGAVYGLSKQGAQQRFGRRGREAETTQS